MLTSMHTMDFNKVWLFDDFQRLARMPSQDFVHKR